MGLRRNRAARAAGRRAESIVANLPWSGLVEGIGRHRTHPVTATVLEVDRKGQQGKSDVFYVRLNTGTRPVNDRSEVEKYVARRWGRSDPSSA